jgi:hypothetical protein
VLELFTLDFIVLSYPNRVGSAKLTLPLYLTHHSRYFAGAFRSTTLQVPDTQSGGKLFMNAAIGHRYLCKYGVYQIGTADFRPFKNGLTEIGPCKAGAP